MELVGIKNKIDTIIEDSVIRNEARKYSIRTRLAFLPDDIIGQSWYFRLLTFIYYYLFIYFHGFESNSNKKNNKSSFDIYSIV